MDEDRLYVASFIVRGVFRVIVLHSRSADEVKDSIRCIEEWRRFGQLQVAPLAEDVAKKFASLELGHIQELTDH